jgi:hypothetical protein
MLLDRKHHTWRNPVKLNHKQIKRKKIKLENKINYTKGGSKIIKKMKIKRIRVKIKIKNKSEGKPKIVIVGLN